MRLPLRWAESVLCIPDRLGPRDVLTAIQLRVHDADNPTFSFSNHHPYISQRSSVDSCSSGASPYLPTGHTCVESTHLGAHLSILSSVAMDVCSYLLISVSCELFPIRREPGNERTGAG